MTTPTNCTVYKYNDENAPVLSGTRGSLCALLKACLVDGYGSKAPAGWTAPFASVDKQMMAFKNSASGTGFFLKVDEKTTASANVPTMQGFELMSNIDSGLGGFPYAPIAQNTFDTIYTSFTASTIARPWMIIANDVGFWLVIYLDSTLTSDLNASNVRQKMKVIYFGDFLPFSQNDAFNCALCVSSGRNYSTNAYDAGLTCGYFGDGNTTVDYQPNPRFYATAPIAYPRGMDGVPGVATQPCMIGGGGPSGYGYFGADSIYGARVHTEGELLLLSRPILPDRNFNTPRGYLPGLYTPSTYLPHATMDTVSDQGQDYIMIKGCPYGNGASTTYNTSFLINISNFWA